MDRSHDVERRRSDTSRQAAAQMIPILSRLMPHAAPVAIGIMGVLCLMLAWTKYQRDEARNELSIERALRERDQATFRAGQAAANADHLQAIIRLKDLNRRLKDDADRENDRLRADFDARVVQLPAWSAGANLGGDAAAAMSGAGSAARPDGPGADPILFTRADAQICADNTRRLIVGHDWAVAPR
jgi:hypothetical protein